jgi:hypothetical protein
MAKILPIEAYRSKQQRLLNRPSFKTRIHFKPLPWEHPAEIDALVARLEQRFPPPDCVERCLLENLIHSSWRLRRLEKLRADALATESARDMRALERSIALARRCHAYGLRMLQQYHSGKNRQREVCP